MNKTKNANISNAIIASEPNEIVGSEMMEIVELDDDMLDDVVGGLADINGNCGCNSGCNNCAISPSL